MRKISNWHWVAFSILMLTVLRGIRAPNLWSYTHFLFNYDFGIVKRGLIGQVISQLDHSYFSSYSFFLLFSTAIFLANFLLIGSILKEYINSKHPILIGCSLLFSSSLAVVYLSHTIGYFDHVGLLITLIAIKLGGFNQKIIFLCMAMPILLLIHEATIAIFFPVIFVSLLLSIEPGSRTLGKIALLFLFSGLMLAQTLFIGNQTLTKSEAYQLCDTLQEGKPIPLTEEAFDVLHWDASDNFTIMKELWSEKLQFFALGMSLLVTAPTFMVFLYYSARSVAENKRTHKYFWTLLFSLASLSPLALHILAWDMHRWNALAVTTSFLVLYVVRNSKYEPKPITLSSSSYQLFAFLLFLNALAVIPLLDEYVVRQFPFPGLQNYLLDLIYGREEFPFDP